MDRGLAQDILEYQDWLGFSIRRDRVRLEDNLPHNESLSLGVCHRFYGKEEELKEAIKRGNGILRGLLTLEKNKGDISRRYLYLFYALVGNMYYFKGDFKLSTGYFMKVLDYEREDLTAWVELLFSLRAVGEYDLFEQGIFNLEQVYKGWRESKEKRMGKEVLVKLIMDKQKHVLGKVEITSRCNQNCLFCPVSHTEKDLPFSEIIKRMGELKESGATEVMFSGGEPTLRTDLPQLIKKAYEMGFSEVCIQTNGSGLYDEELLKSYRREGPVKFDISFHTHRKEIFERINGGKDSFDRFLKGVENIRKHKAFAYFTVVISSLNYKELKEQIEFAEENFPDIKHFSFNFVDPNGNALENKWIVPRLSEAEPYMKDAFGHILSKGMTFRIEFVPLCFLDEFEEYASEVRREEDEEWSFSSFVNKNEEVVKRNNNYTKTERCNGCSLFERCPGLNPRYAKIYGTEELKPIRNKKHDGHYIVNINHRCNFNCVFCADTPEDRKNPDYDYEFLINGLIDNKNKFESLIISGGEPTIYPRLIEYIKYAKERCGYKRITLTTNGFLLSDKSFVDELVDAGVDEFIISFLSSDPENYDKISGVKGSFEKVVSAIRNVRREEKRFRANIVIHKLNVNELPDIVTFLAKEGAESIQLSFMNPVGSSIINGKSTIAISYKEVLPFVKKALETAKEIGFNEIYIENFPICIIPDQIKRISDLRKPPLNKEYYNLSKTKVGCCSKCRYGDICDGMWKAYVEQFGEEEIIPIKKSAEEGDNFRKKVYSDLKLFRLAIEKKPNKNNIYDTYSYFLMENIGFKDKMFIYDSWEGFTEKIRLMKAPDLLGLYIHFPFCKSACDYCVYPSTNFKDEEEIDRYIDYLIEEMAFFSPLFNGLVFRSLYIGGGTPSLMSKAQLRKLVNSVHMHFRFDEYGEKAIEFNPNTTTYEKLKVLEEFGFNKLSMGIQSLSQRVLNKNNRCYQTLECVKLAVNDLRKTKIGHLNLDLIIGLRDDTPEEFLMSFEEICKLQPSNISIYPIKTNEEYINTRYGGNLNKFTEFYYPLFDTVVKKMPGIAERYGYYTNSEKPSYVHPFHFVLKNIQRRDVKYEYSNYGTDPHSNLGLGYYAESCINDVMRYTLVDQNHVDGMFLKRFSNDRFSFSYMVFQFLPNYDKVKYITHSTYRDFSISRREYKSRFGIDIIEEFPYAINALSLLNIITIGQDKIIFNTKDEKDLYPYLLFFVGINSKVSKW